MAEKKPDPRKLFMKFNADPGDKATREALRGEIKSRAAVVVAADGKTVNVDRTMKALHALDELGDDITIPGAVTLDALFALQAPTFEADAITRALLIDGETQDGDGRRVNWNPVRVDWRLAVGLAAHRGRLPFGTTSRTATQLLAGENPTPPPPWPDLLDDWQKLETRASAGDEAAIAEVATVRARLRFKREAAPVQPPFPVAATPEVSAPPAPDGAIVVHVIAAEDDARYIKEFEVAIHGLKRDKLVRITGAHTLPAGAERRSAMARMVAGADAFVLLVTAAALSSKDGEIAAALDEKVRRGVRVIPVWVKPCDTERTELARLAGLPQSGRPITSGDADMAWVEVSRGISAVVQSMRAGRR